MMIFRLDHHHWTFESNETLLLGIQIFGHRGFEGNDQLAKTPFTSLRDWMVNSQKLACRDGPKETINVDEDSFLEVTNLRGITRLRGPWSEVPNQTHKANFRFATAHITGYGHFMNHLSTVGLLQGDISCRLFVSQAPDCLTYEYNTGMRTPGH